MGAGTFILNGQQAGLLVGGIRQGVPSVVRGLLIPMALSFQALKPTVGALVAAGMLGILVYSLAFWSLSRLDETFGKELDFVDE